MQTQIIDGAVNLINGTPFTPPTTSAEPFALRFKVKTGLTSFALSGAFDPTNVTAVDWGLDAEVDYTPFSEESKPCGEELTIFIRPTYQSFGNGLYIYDEPFSAFLSQIDTLHTPFPNWFGQVGEIRLVITNEDFKAPDGIFENIDLLPVFGQNWRGYSTFKTAPKIWASLKEFAFFPGIGNQLYAPFANCPNVTKIEPQGEFGDELEELGPCDFMQFDEEGFADPSAYPSGGAPRVIKNYTIPVNKYSFDRGYAYPQFDVSRLEICLDGFESANFYVGQSTPAAGATLPFGISVNDASNLRDFSVSLPKIILESGNYTGYFYYGAKALGIKLPAGVEAAYGLFEIDNLYVEEQADPGNNPPLYPDLIKSHQIGIQPLTPAFAKTKLSFGYGEALEKIFAPDETLILPTPHAGLKAVSNYGLNKGANTGVTYVVPNGTDWGYYQVPPLPEGCEIVQGYCQDAYAGQTLGVENFLKFGETGEELEIKVTGNVIIPALPQSARIVRNYLKGCFRGARGNAKDTKITNPEAAERKTYLFYGESANENESLTGANVLANFDPQIDGLIEQEWGHRHGTGSLGPDDGFNLLDIFIAENSGGLPETYKTNLLSGGIVIESQPLPNLEYALNWQEDCWLDATIDPTTIDTLIVPIPEGTKSENAYNRALNIGIPTTDGQLYFYSGETWGRKDNGELADNEDGKNRPLRFVTWVNPFSPVDVKQYDRYLSDLTLPDLTIVNGSGHTYEAFQSAFGNIYGNPDEVFDRFGIDLTITETEVRRAYVGLNAPDYVESNAAPWAPLLFTWRKSLVQTTPTGFLEGKWLSIPVIESDIPSGEKHPAQQEALYAYKYQYAKINNAPDSVPEQFNLTNESGAGYFRSASLTW
jgi:hypothetical protein